MLLSLRCGQSRLGLVEQPYHPAYHIDSTQGTSEKEALMSESVVYRSRVRIERVKGPLRRAYLPVEPQPVLFGR